MGTPPATPSDFVPTGVYQGRALSGDWKVSSKKGSNFCEVLCEITQEGPYKGRRLFCSLHFTSEDTIDRSMRSLAACGVDMSDPLTLRGIQTSEIDLTVEIRDPRVKEDGSGWYPAENRVAWINEKGSSAKGRSMNENERMAFGAQLLGYAAKMNMSGPRPATAAPPNGGAASPPPSAGAPGASPFNKF